jgi:transcriptional regulator of acetoin/glycerol metabolism
VSQALIQQALRESAGHQAEAAKRLGISRTTLWRKLKEFNDEVTLENR